MNMIQIEKGSNTYNLFFNEETIRVTQGGFNSEALSLSLADAAIMEDLIAEEIYMSEMELAAVKKKGLLPC